MTASSPPDSSRPSLRPSVWPPPPPRGVVARVGDWAVRFLEHLGGVYNMLIGATKAGFRRPFEGKAILEQVEALGVASVGIVVVTSVFIGMVMAVQFAFGLRKFGGMEYTGRVVVLSFTRELAPSLTAIIVGGRIGSGMAAEVGAMSVTEQIDAVRALGADPLKKLVWPRLFAATMVMPLLSAFALVLGFSGAMLITDLEFHIPSSFFLSTALQVVTMQDFVAGMLKTPFFGAIIALVGCHFGMSTKGGTVGVGNSTTRSVVTISIAILIADFFLTKIGILLWPNL
ncbi:MAG TPA: ABC transporter permease [Polyangiaceae bacterium]|jgi:phospholipid/cholesterol/gamma-HCH transport system permease protein|nr:ABC transporter permease [Polyangiaceae bacterium]